MAFLNFSERVMQQTTNFITSKFSRAAAALSAGLASITAHAGPALPWDGPITTLVNNLTGPVATGISTVAFLAAGAALIFGGDDMGAVAKKLLYVVLGVALIVFGANFLSMLGLVNTGALI
jgi:type IV secretory pathway VirB2 component (pilin)